MTRLVCLSDTHCKLSRIDVPDGDVLVHAGDATNMGSHDEVAQFAAQLKRLPHAHKVVIAGNHDWLFARRPALARRLIEDAGAIYLEDSAATVAGLRFWGGPWQPAFCNWAFNLPRGPELAAKWAAIPDAVDVLVTHGPPRGVLDSVRPGAPALGCADLADAIARVRPRVHVFGHIHGGAGVLERDGTTFVNASVLNELYMPVRPATVIDV